MQVAITARFLRDFRDLSAPLGNKCRELISELARITPSRLREHALPGWRLHKLRSSKFVSLSLDMNYRVLAEMDGDVSVLHRVVRHDEADQAHVNRNDHGVSVGRVTQADLSPRDLHDALTALGVPEEEARPFRACTTEDEVLDALAASSPSTATLALSLYETSGLVIPHARFHILHNDDHFSEVLEGGGKAWEIYLHPSQEFIVDLPVEARTAVVGSAGTGKTICAWHRCRRLMAAGHSVGFACPSRDVLDVSKRALTEMAVAGTAESYYLVPRSADELIQLSESVDHLLIDEGQEVPWTWLQLLGARMRDRAGITLLYDLNQLGGSIPNNDTARYKRRLEDWKNMLGAFPRMQRLRLSINYRNSREIAAHYLALLSDALPARPSSDVPAFESGEVVQHCVRSDELVGFLASTLNRLLRDHSPREIGVVAVDRQPTALREALATCNVPVSHALSGDRVFVGTAAEVRGHERRAMVVVCKSVNGLQRNFGIAIDAYIAMSRAIQRLLVIEEH